MTALVVFRDSRSWWLRLLKRGFRHVYVVVFDGERWVHLEFASNGTTVQSIDPAVDVRA